jgi:D-alanyl-D-alanine carboxypeptidase
MRDAVVEVVRANFEVATTPTRASTAVVSVFGPHGACTVAFDRADAQARTDPPERFLLYSFTKTIAAAAVLRLVERGRLILDATLETWLPERPVAASITLRQLLQHTSGLPDYGDLSEYHKAVCAGRVPWTEDEFFNRTSAHQLRSKPGERWRYSNIGYMLVRCVLERACNSDFASILHQELFDPLGVASASVPTDQSDLASFTFGPSPYLAGDDAPPVAVPEHYHPGWIATGVVGSSIVDAARILHGILTTDILPTDLRAMMCRAIPIAKRGFLGPRYGLGLMIETTKELNPAYGHLGGGPGCSTAVFHFPSVDHAMTVAAATDGEDVLQAEDIAASVARKLNRSWQDS